MFAIFVLECNYGMFGTNCSEKCGNCLNLDQCHHINGSCLDDCAPGFQGVTCTEGNSDSFIDFIEEKKRNNMKLN